MSSVSQIRRSFAHQAICSFTWLKAHPKEWKYEMVWLYPAVLYTNNIGVCIYMQMVKTVRKNGEKANESDWVSECKYYEQASNQPTNSKHQCNTDGSNKEQNASKWVYMQIIQQNKQNINLHFNILCCMCCVLVYEWVQFHHHQYNTLVQHIYIYACMHMCVCIHPHPSAGSKEIG